MKGKIVYFLIIGLLAGLWTSCTPNVDPKEQFTTKEISEFKYKIARYICHLPKYATEESKFLSQFDEAYKESSTKVTLNKLYKGSNDTIYFEVSKLAPSLKKKYNATGGKLVFNTNKELVYYEEVYRTWKLETELLQERTAVFFDEMINHKDLSPYYTENINDDTYIEFPNKNCIFDISNRKWIIKQDLAYNR